MTYKISEIYVIYNHFSPLCKQIGIRSESFDCLIADDFVWENYGSDSSKVIIYWWLIKHKMLLNDAVAWRRFVKAWFN